MLYIGICDDNSRDLERIYLNVVKAFFEEEEIKVEQYHSGKEVTDAIKNGNFCCELLYLDIHMSPTDGIETADYIRKHEVDVDIIFVTNSPDYVFKGYTYKAYAYILKSSLETELWTETKRYIKESRAMEECLNISAEGMKHKIPISQVCYVESNARKLILHLKNDTICFYAKMADIEQMLLPRGFVRTHQSYLVRSSNINKIGKNSVWIGEEEIPVSRKYYSSIKSIFS